MGTQINLSKAPNAYFTLNRNIPLNKLNVKMSSKQGHDLQQSVRHSCVNADLFENEPPYTIVKEDEENTTGAYNKSNDTMG